MYTSQSQCMTHLQLICVKIVVVYVNINKRPTSFGHKQIYYYVLPDVSLSHIYFAFAFSGWIYWSEIIPCFHMLAMDAHFLYFNPDRLFLK